MSDVCAVPNGPEDGYKSLQHRLPRSAPGTMSDCSHVSAGFPRLEFTYATLCKATIQLCNINRLLLCRMPLTWSPSSCAKAATPCTHLIQVLPTEASRVGMPCSAFYCGWTAGLSTCGWDAFHYHAMLVLGAGRTEDLPHPRCPGFHSSLR
jgi:hypothetical protein